nr:MAG TPA: hypothetical protein [Caudoviricetes sp.]
MSPQRGQVFSFPPKIFLILSPYIYNLLIIHAPITTIIIASAITLFIFFPFYFPIFWKSS